MRAPTATIRQSTRAEVPDPDRRWQPRGARPGEPNRADLCALILGSYLEMPGLTLHLEQAARLFGVRARTCQTVLTDLVDSGHLRRRPDGQFVKGDL